MITLTDDAVSAIQILTTQPDVPQGSGLRIATDDTRGALALSVAAQPAQGDAVVESGGARLFLDATAAAALGDKALDARAEADGQVLFTVTEPDA